MHTHQSLSNAQVPTVACQPFHPPFSLEKLLYSSFPSSLENSPASSSLSLCASPLTSPCELHTLPPLPHSHSLVAPMSIRSSGSRIPPPASGEFTPKNVLITGGAGFIASHVVIHFVKKYPQYKIVNLDKLDYCSSLANLKEIENAPNYKFVKGNICSSDFLNYIMKSEEIDTILHFAAQTHVDNSFGNSFQFTENNILGTHTLLEASKVNNIKRFVHVSTDEVYGEIEEGEGFEHSTILQPTNPYAATKAGAEFLVLAYHNSFKLPTIITRGNNVYGPHQYPEKLIPKFICLLNQGKQCFIHGDGSNQRNFLFVTDVANAFDTITHKGGVGNVYNIGTDFEISNLEVAKQLIGLFGLEEEKHMIFVENRPFNDCRYKINSDKLMALGWKPEVSWDEGLKRTIEWYKENMRNWPRIENALVPHPRAGMLV